MIRRHHIRRWQLLHKHVIDFDIKLLQAIVCSYDFDLPAHVRMRELDRIVGSILDFLAEIFLILSLFFFTVRPKADAKVAAAKNQRLCL